MAEQLESACVAPPNAQTAELAADLAEPAMAQTTIKESGTPNKAFASNALLLAPVNKIIPFSAVDGPGNRTAIFLQGCNINCKYCHNPETRALCQHCGDCIATCPAGALAWGDAPAANLESDAQVHADALSTSQKKGAAVPAQGQVVFNPSLCVGCDACIATCQHDASPKILWQSAQDVFAQVRRQLPFIRGITVSGGECMLHPAFLRELFTLCKAAGLGTLIDSNGTVSFAAYPDLMAVTDGVMLDVKAFTPADSLAVTGAENATVLQNAKDLAQWGKLAELRTVVVPDLCDAAQLIRDLAAYLSTPSGAAAAVSNCAGAAAQNGAATAGQGAANLGSLRYKLIAYRPFGVRAAYRDMHTPTPEQMQTLADLALQQGFGEVIIL